MGIIIFFLYMSAFFAAAVFFIWFLKNKEFRYDTILPCTAVKLENDGIVFGYTFKGTAYEKLYDFKAVVFSDSVFPGSKRHILISSKDPLDCYRYIFK